MERAARVGSANGPDPTCFVFSGFESSVPCRAWPIIASPPAERQLQIPDFQKRPNRGASTPRFDVAHGQLDRPNGQPGGKGPALARGLLGHPGPKWSSDWEGSCHAQQEIVTQAAGTPLDLQAIPHGQRGHPRCPCVRPEGVAHVGLSDPVAAGRASYTAHARRSFGGGSLHNVTGSARKRIAGSRYFFLRIRTAKHNISV